MLGGTLKRWIAIALLWPGLALADTFTVTDIRIQGLQRVSAGTVFNLLPINVGDSFDEATIRQLIRLLFAVGIFSGRQAEPRRRRADRRGRGTTCDRLDRNQGQQIHQDRRVDGGAGQTGSEGRRDLQAVDARARRSRTVHANTSHKVVMARPSTPTSKSCRAIVSRSTSTSKKARRRRFNTSTSSATTRSTNRICSTYSN